MTTYPPAFPHGDLREVLPDIFFVTGASVILHEGMEVQKSNNMVIVRNGRELTLVNTLRLDEDGLKRLEGLGRVAHVVRIGAFHDRNDLFYLDRYQARLWALPGMQHRDQRQADVELQPGVAMPFPESCLFVFATTALPEGIVYIAREGGVLISCDSIKNWTGNDRFFSPQTWRSFRDNGLIASASVDAVWLGAMRPEVSEFQRLSLLKFQHLLSAHGEPLLHDAERQLARSIAKLVER